MKSQDNYPLIRTLSLGGESDDRKQIPSQGLSKQRVQGQRETTKSGMTGLVHQHPMGGTAPGGGGGTPPPGKGGPPDDKGDDESEEEDEEDDTDEETVSVTSSSQVSARRARPLIWSSGTENMKDSEGGPPEDPNDPSGGGSAGDGHRGPRGHRGQRGRTGPPGRDGATGPMGPVGPRGSRKGWFIHHWGSTHFHGAGNTPYIQCKLEYHWHGKFFALSGRITESCDAISAECESKYGRTPKYDREKSVAPGSSFRAISGKYTTKGI